MSRVDEYLKLIDDPKHPALTPGHPADAALLSLLVQLAWSDGVVQGDEFALLQRVRPDLDPGDLMTWADEVAAGTLDLDALAAAAPSQDDRWNVLRLAARMVCLDGDVAEEEVDHLQEIAAHLRLPDGAGRRVVDEVVARGGEVTRAQALDALRNMFWDVLIPSRDELAGPLASVVPADARPVCSISLDGLEVAGLFLEGLAGSFDGGPAFVRWSDIGTYTRVPVPGAGFHLHTREGRHLSMSDPRLRDIGALLDFIHGRTPVPR